MVRTGKYTDNITVINVNNRYLVIDFKYKRFRKQVTASVDIGEEELCSLIINMLDKCIAELEKNLRCMY